MSNNNGSNNTAAAITIEKILDGNVREREGRNGRIHTTSRERVQWLVLVNGAVESTHDTKREARARVARLSNTTAKVISDDARTCPSCGAEAIEFHTAVGEPRNAIARLVNTRGPREGLVFYVAGGCEVCGASFEVAGARS